MVKFENLKMVYDLLEKAHRLDLVKDIQDLREELLSAREDNHKFRESNAELKEQLKLKSQIVYDKDICWVLNDEMTTGNGKTPICPKCWQIDGIVN